MVSSATTDPEPVKRLPLTPVRGPLHFLLLLATCTLLLLLPLAYAAAVLGLGAVMVWQAYVWVVSATVAELLTWNSVLPVASAVILGITWFFMLRPLRSRPLPGSSSIQVTAQSQPELFELVDGICWHLNVDPPQEIWLDTRSGIRSCLQNGFSGAADGVMALHIGLPAVTALSVREFATLLVRELAMNTGGASTPFSLLMREVNVWLGQALQEGDARETALRERLEKNPWHRKAVRQFIRLWMMAAKLPFALLVLIGRGLSSPAMTRLAAGADHAAGKMAGGMWPHLQSRMKDLQRAWAAVQTEILQGCAKNCLPDSLPLLLSRHAKKSSQQRPAMQPDAGHRTEPDAEITAGILGKLSPAAPASTLVCNHAHFSRQVTCLYYRHELGIALSENRLVNEEEGGRQEDESLVILRRYFGGMAHPERTLCGLRSTHAASPGPEQLKAEIQQARKEAALCSAKLTPALHEWNLTWLKRRDLEAAALLSMAGFSISRVRISTEDTSSQSLRGESARLRILMERMEAALTVHEAHLESRFAAALGLLWWSQRETLDEALAARRKDLPKWVSIYETLAGPLPAFRELLTLIFAFQSLGPRYVSLDNTGNSFPVLQSVVPRMISLTRQVVSSLDGSQFPFTLNNRPVPLKNHLMQGKLPDPVSISMNPGATADLRALSAKMAADASGVIAPFADRYLNLYHEAYAWLAETAELVEMHFLGDGLTETPNEPPSAESGPPLTLPQRQSIFAKMRSKMQFTPDQEQAKVE